MPWLRLLLVLAVFAGLLSLPAAAAPSSGDDASLYRIPLSSGAVDPAADWSATEPVGRDLVLVQWSQFGAVGIVDAIAATGAELVQPLAPVSYLVWADAAQTRALRGVDGVRFAGVLPAQARVADSVTPASTRLRVTVVGTEGLGGLSPASVRPRAFTAVDGAVVEVPGGPAQAAVLARLPRVYSVADAGGRPQLRDEKSSQVVAQGTAQPLGPGYAEFLERIGADGSGVVIAEVDGGVDWNHPELSDRVADCIDYSVLPAGGLCNARNHDDAIGHGTHVLGIVLGTGSTGLGDADGFAYGQGIAPGAKAVVQNAVSLNALYPDPFADGYRPVYQQAQERGAIVSQNSWGPSGTPQGYDAATREFDSIVRDANDDQEGDQPLALVFSIMNGSGGTSTQGAPDEAKNIIGVGGSGVRGTRTSAGPTADDLCTCTAHGPALDGRMLPDLVAPGQNVMSTRATQGTLCGLFPTAESTPSPLHAGCTGTSMASPHVTGGYAVFVDWYRQHHDGATPSPALVKAAFVNGADDLAGGRDANGRRLGHIPDNKQGWGRFNLGNVVDSWAAGAVHVDQSVVFDTTGEQHAVTVEPIDPAQPMKATLAWTDALGPGMGGQVPAWVNDLDLSVAAPDGTTYKGNVFADGFSVAGGDHDRRNNVENVYLPTPAAGAHTVTVSAANLIGDGLPNRDGTTDQDFALVVTNARVVQQ
ncbi:MAG TPA: S8 family serine peptidase [Egibacteraceae bacterium]|nr:S8 family serine peptidase [Egibacteraceae bacterium]